jgi:hypothetical protein
MNFRLRKRSDVTSATSTSFNPSAGSGSTTTRPLFSRKPTRPNRLTHPPAMRATNPQPSSRATGSRSRSRPRIPKKRHHIRPHKRRTTSSHYTLTPSPFTSYFPPVQDARTPPPRGVSARCKFLLSTLRRKLHLINFDFLMQLSRFRVWISAKLKLHKLMPWLKTHILRVEPEPRRPFFPRGPSYCEGLHQQQQASRSGSKGSGSGGEEKKGRIRRLSQSTVKSLKKVCSLNSERDELREEDRRAMERLDELWRTREEHLI